MHEVFQTSPYIIHAQDALRIMQVELCESRNLSCTFCSNSERLGSLYEFAKRVPVINEFLATLNAVLLNLCL